MAISSYLDRKRESLARELHESLQQMDSLPEGELYFVRNGTGWMQKRRWRTADGHRKSEALKKSDRLFAQKLAQRRYLSERARGLRKLIQAIELAMQTERELVSFPDNLQEMCGEYRELLRPFFSENEQKIREWKEKPYRTKEEHKESRIYPTKCGVLVRSKSEVIIADMLYDLGIPFRYEQELVTDRGMIFPDFLILDPFTLEEIVWEHCGMMDDPEYARKVFSRLDSLHSRGYSFEKKNLICTFESKTHPLDVREVQMIIDYYFQK